MAPAIRLAGVGVIAAAALALSACSTAEPGAAAVVGDTRIEQSQIGEQVRAVNELLGRAPDEPAPEAASAIVSYNVVDELLEQTAREFGVTVTQTELDQAYGQTVQGFGSEEQLRKDAANQFIPPDKIRQAIRSQLLATALANRIAPELAQDAQRQQQAVIEAIGAQSVRLGVQVAPRYGQWDPQTLRIVPTDDPVSRPEVTPTPSPPLPMQ